LNGVFAVPPLARKLDATRAIDFERTLELAGVARTGPIPPFVSELSSEQKTRLAPVVQELLTQQQELVAGD
jgi:hypothetical protein